MDSPAEGRELRRMLRRLNIWARRLPARERIRPDHVLDETKGLGDLDPYDMFFSAAAHFGVPTSKEEVRTYCGMGLDLPREEYIRQFRARRTWDGLAKFLLSKLQTVSVREAHVLGQRCGPAGAFRAIRDIAHELGVRDEFKPSDRICDHLKGRTLHHCWARLSWLTRHRLPRLQRAKWMENGNCLMLAAALALLVGWWATSPILMTAAAGLACAGSILRSAGPRPHWSLVTFRDLSLAVWRNGAPRDTDFGQPEYVTPPRWLRSNPTR